MNPQVETFSECPQHCIPPSVFIGGPPACCTWVIILEGPPAAAITYVNDSIGLDPSVYGGGGSPSSEGFPEGSPFCSGEKDDLASATMSDCGDDSEGSSRGGGGAKAGIGADSDSVIVSLGRLASTEEVKKSDEKVGGFEDEEQDENASDGGEWVGGPVYDSSSAGESV